MDLGLENWPERLRNDGWLCFCPSAHQQLHCSGAHSLTMRVSVFKEGEIWICSCLLDFLIAVLAK